MINQYMIEEDEEATNGFLNLDYIILYNVIAALLLTIISSYMLDLLIFV